MTTAVILAAGRGSRMRALTDSKPKCLLELAGRPLLHWQLDALHAAGLADIVVVRGYKAEMLQGDFRTVDNPRWEATNMVQTLLCGLHACPQEDVLVAYADIVYTAGHVRRLLATGGDICLTYDTQWEALWRLRNANPLDDAETFRQQGGILQEIGGKPQSLSEVAGQYMGLLKFTPAGAARLRAYVESLPPAEADALDMTGLIRRLMAQGEVVHVCPVQAGWCECDTGEDIARYETQLAQGTFSHDWR